MTTALVAEALEARRLLTTYTVDTFDDVSDGDFSAGNLSLREAIEQANANPGADAVEFSAALNGGTIVLSGTELTVDDDLTITGPGAELLTIDGNDASRILLLDGETNGPIDVLISGLTFTGGYATGGGVERNGGAIANFYGNLTLTGSTLDGNAAESGGGGLYSIGGTVLVSENTFSNNTATAGGGGIAHVDGEMTIDASVITGNTAPYGAGIYNSVNATISIKQSMVADNAADSGGGLYNGTGSSVVIEASTLARNSATTNGGAVYLHYGVGYFVNSTFSGNTANENGGGLYSSFGTATFTNATITANVADAEGNDIGEGGGIYTRLSTIATTTLFNTLIAGNVRDIGAFEQADDVSGDSLTYNSAYNLFGNAATSGGIAHGYAHNIVGNAGVGTLLIEAILDTDLEYNGGLTPTHALLDGSLAIDAGRSNIAVDAEGNPLTSDQRGSDFARSRSTGDAVGISVEEFSWQSSVGESDIGAFEAQDLLVNTAVDEIDWSVTSTGLSLREAIELSNMLPGVQTIRVSAQQGLESNAWIMLQHGELTITDSVTIAAVDPTEEFQRIDAGGLSRVFLLDHADLNPVNFNVTLLGLELKNGDTAGDGGALLNEDADLTVVSSLFYDHMADGDGGAISSGFFGSLTLAGVHFQNNTAGGNGGAVSLDGGSLALPEVDTSGWLLPGNTFDSNTSGGNGGGLFSNGAHVTLRDIEFTNNTAGTGGGAIFMNGGSLALTAAVVSDNRVLLGNGGGISTNGGTHFVSDSIISTNIAPSNGGGLSMNGGTLTVESSQFIGNTAGGSGGGISTNGALKVINSSLTRNTAEADGGAVSNELGNVTFVNSTIYLNQANADGGFYGSGGGVWTLALGGSQTTLHNTLVLANVVGFVADLESADTTVLPNSDLAGLAVAAGSSHNLIGDADSAGGLTHGVNGNLLGNAGAGVIDPTVVLAPVGDLLLPADMSPVIDAGRTSLANDANGEPLTTDQRGNGHFRRYAAAVDIGALEYQPEVHKQTDIVGRALSGTLYVGQSDGSRFVMTPAGAIPLAADWDDLLTGDFNGDGWTDLAGRSPTDGTWKVLLSDGAMFASAQEWGTWTTSVSWSDVRVGDFNGDGRDDIAGRASTGTWAVALSNGAGFTTSSFGAWSTIVSWENVVVGDFNDDGRDDIAGRASTGTWVVGLSNGTKLNMSVFGAWSTIVTWSNVSVGDFNGDGKSDIMGRASTGTVVVGLSDGARFTMSAWTALTPSIFPQENLVVGDFNGDGRTDIAARATSGTWVVGLSNGMQFQNSVFGGWSNLVTWTDVIVGDFNGDAVDDIAGRASTGTWVVAVSNGESFNTNVFGVWSTLTTWDNVHGGEFA